MRPGAQESGAPAVALLIALGVLAGCGEDAGPDDVTNPVHSPEIARVLPAGKAIAGAHVAMLDPATMVDAEIDNVLGPDSRCEFRYTSEGRPVLAAKAAAGGEAPAGVVKLNGHLVPLQREAADAQLIALRSGEVRLTVTPDGGAPVDDARQREANATFEVGSKLRVGYRGYYRCTG
jgi:hypothetical protein